jgi:methylthioribose-1-phosphate isomerase
MRAGEIDLVVVGVDRIAANAATANKIGTYCRRAGARASDSVRRGASVHVDLATTTAGVLSKSAINVR